MAMIQCPECQKEVSDNAVMCPNCGYGVKAHFDSIKQVEHEKELAQKREASSKKIKKYLKIWIPICAFVICISVVTLWFLTSYGGKTTKHCGIYDTKTKNYIDIGDSRENIEKIIGTGAKNDKISVSGSTYYEYSDNLDISYDEHDNAEYIHVNYFSFHGDTYRYTLFDESGNESTEAEFANKHSHPYQTSLETVIFLRKTFAGYKETTKEKLQSIEKGYDFSIEELESYIEVSFDTLGITVDLCPIFPEGISDSWDKYEEIKN